MKKILVLTMAALVLLAGCGKDVSDDAPVYAAPPASSPQAAPPPTDPAESSSVPHNAPLPTDDGGVIEITERLFIAQTNDMYLNAPDYLGRTIKYEGIYKNTDNWPEPPEAPIHYVIRYGPGCCGYDGEAGFEVRWDGEYPNPDDWVEVVGVLCEEAYESGYKILYVEVISLTVKDERGAEYVAT